MKLLVEEMLSQTMSGNEQQVQHAMEEVTHSLT
jgi:hypothetical protein